MTDLPLSGAANPPITHRTYSALVRENDDLVGHVAYALYKRDKLKFCEEHADGNGGQLASSAELAIFIRSSNLRTRLDGYRSEAELLLRKMTEYQLEDAISQVEAEADAELLRKFRESKSWRRSTGEALLGSVVSALVWGAIVFVVYASKIGPERLVVDFFSSSKASAPASLTSP